MAENLVVENWPMEKLIPYARNPRINDEAVPKLAGLIREFGFKVPLVIRSDGTIIDGHERYKAAMMLGLKEVPVTIADEWTDAQVKAFRLAVNRSAEWAKWDFDLLSCELDELKELDFDLGKIDFDLGDVNIDLKGEGWTEGEAESSETRTERPEYTGKIATPIYEPSGKNISLTDCYDAKKYNELIIAIDNSSVPDDVKTFLRLAATRHIAFHYENIADYYSNAPKNVQQLMEDSALVIVDYNSAIEKGFFKLTKSLNDMFDAEEDCEA